MTDMPVFIVANLHQSDAVLYSKYREGLPAILQRHKGMLLASDDQADTLEGTSPIDGRFVIFRFTTENHARNLLRDPEYQSLADNRRRGTSTHFMSLVRGLSDQSN